MCQRPLLWWEPKKAVQLSTTWPNITIEDAYAISTEVAQRKIAAGAKLIGHKVGLTSKAMQRSSQIDEPDYGLPARLHDDRGRRQGPARDYCRPRVEIELAFILGKPLKGPGVGLPEVLRATEYVVPAIEIVDARLQDPRKIFDTVADNGAAAGIVIGGRPVGPMDVDLRWVGGIMYKNSEIEETGVAAGVLGHPALGVAWLANKLGSHGVPLEPATSCSPARSPAWCSRRRATRCTPTSARSAASRCIPCGLRRCGVPPIPASAPRANGRGRGGRGEEGGPDKMCARPQDRGGLKGKVLTAGRHQGRAGHPHRRQVRH